MNKITAVMSLFLMFGVHAQRDKFKKSKNVLISGTGNEAEG
jgi:hypothetical protein